MVVRAIHQQCKAVGRVPNDCHPEEGVSPTKDLRFFRNSSTFPCREDRRSLAFAQDDKSQGKRGQSQHPSGAGRTADPSHSLRMTSRREAWAIAAPFRCKEDRRSFAFAQDDKSKGAWAIAAPFRC